LSEKIENFLILQVAFVNLIVLFLIIYFIFNMASSASLELTEGMGIKAPVDITD